MQTAEIIAIILIFVIAYRGKKMKEYKYAYKFVGSKKLYISYTTDKIYADFMNKGLTFWQRIKLFFSR